METCIFQLHQKLLRTSGRTLSCLDLSLKGTTIRITSPGRPNEWKGLNTETTQNEASLRERLALFWVVCAFAKPAMNFRFRSSEMRSADSDITLRKNRRMQNTYRHSFYLAKLTSIVGCNLCCVNTAVTASAVCLVRLKGDEKSLMLRAGIPESWIFWTDSFIHQQAATHEMTALW